MLLVEEDVPLRSRTAEYLRLSGCRTIEAGSASEALALLTSNTRIDLLVTDFSMSGGRTGLRLAEWMERQFPEVPLIVTSADRSLIARLPAGKRRRVIVKPYALSEVRQQIDELLRR